MANPSINPLPQAPNRAMARTVYPVVADAWAAAIGPWTTQVNDVVTWMGKQVDAIAASVKAVSDSATAAGQAVTDAQAQVKLATDQAQASKGSAESAAGSLASVKVVAQAVDAAAGLPPANLPGGVLRQALDGSGKKEWWLPVLSQVGDTVTSTQAPTSDWVPTGGIYLQSTYPALYAKLGKIPDFRDDQFQTFNWPGNSTVNLGSMAYGNGMLFAQGIPANTNDYRFLYTKDFGVTWNTLIKNANYQVNQIAFGNNLFLAPDNGGNIVTIFDTTTYQSSISYLPSQGNWFYCVFGNNTFIVLASGGSTSNQARSTDNGKTWQTSTFPTDMVNIGQVIYFNGLFMVFSGSSTFAFYYTSPDGLSWTKRAAPAALNFSLRNTVTTNGTLIAMDASTTYKTTNGINWTNNLGGNPFNYVAGAWAVCAGDGVFLAIPTSTYSGKVYFSMDGFIWSSRNKFITPTTQGIYTPIYAGGNFLASVGQQGYIWKIKGFSYNTSLQFYASDAPQTGQIGFTQYVRAN